MRPVLACALALLVPACAIVNAPGDHQGGEIPVDRFCVEYADLGCRAHLDCCPSPTVTYEDCLTAWIDACRMRSPDAPLVPSFEEILRDPRTGYSPDAAARALAQGRRITATCGPEILDWFVERDGLQGAMVGTVPAGGTCQTREVPEVAPLFSCADYAQSCRAGSPWRCAPRLAAGSEEPCYLDLDCAEGAYCRPALIPDTPGRCIDRASDGGSCNEAAACESRVCAGSTCVARDPLALYCSLSAGVAP